MIRVIGAGLPRTATTSLMVALEQIGFGPCYHMRDLMADLGTSLPIWEAVVDGDQPWESIFKDAQSTLDWPSARYWRELMVHYPDAKVILSVRSPESWVKSMRDTIWPMYFGDSVMHHLLQARELLDPSWARFIALMRRMTWNAEDDAPLAGNTFDDAEFAALMQRWNDEVIRTVPAERLLVWDPQDGWEPLCRFLGVETPAGELPRVNDTLGFTEGIIGGALEVVNHWWDQRDRPDSGLHGATIP